MNSQQGTPKRKRAQLLCIASSVTSTSSGKKVYGRINKKGEDSLAGVMTDLHTMYQWAIKNKVVYQGRMQLGSELLTCTDKKGLLKKIREFFQKSKQYKKTYLYYTGHGDEQGNWALETTKGTKFISPQDIFKIWGEVNPSSWGLQSELLIILDQCFAGKWFEVKIKKIYREQFKLCFSPTKITIHASCRADQTSRDWGLKKGGAFTYTKYGGVQKELPDDQNPQKNTILEIGTRLGQQLDPIGRLRAIWPNKNRRKTLI